MKNIELPFENAVVAKTHTQEYLMHKYWARKPPNVVSEYLKYYTEPGDIVLDPFGGSGVTIIEAAKLGRSAIYNDLSPTATFIAEVSFRDFDVSKIIKIYDDIYNDIGEEINSLYITKCSKCHKGSIITHTIWEKDDINTKDKMYLIKSTCPYCDFNEERSPNEEDYKVFNKVSRMPITKWYPKDKMIPNGRLLVKEGMQVSDLFTHRAIMGLSILWAEILKIKDANYKKLFQFIFTSSLSQSSKLVPVISSSGRENEVGSWSFPGFWVPDKYFEINILNCFRNRFNKIKKGKEIRFGNQNKVCYFSNPAWDLNSVKNNSIDYIFADPPYGDSVPYFEYQIMWASWLKQRLDYKNEIIISDAKERNKGIDDYKALLSKSFHELYRVLKANAWMTVTFHNSHMKVWNALVSTAIEAGFVYENDCYVLTGRQSTNQLVRKSGSMTGDIYINFKKPKVKLANISKDLKEVKEEIFKESDKVITERGGQATTDQLARGILMSLSKHNLFEKVLDLKLSDILSEHYDYNKEDGIWTLREDKDAKLLEYIPLETRIITVIDTILSKKGKEGYSLDEFLVPIFTKFKNGRTPDAKDIISVLRARAEEKKGKWYPLAQQEFEFHDIQEIYMKEIEEDPKLQTEHNAIIYQLAKIGLKQNFSIWIGENEKRKSQALKRISMQNLEIPGISNQAIKESRIDQIDLIWIDIKKAIYVLFEVENSTRMINCIPRLANLTDKLPHIKIPIYIVIPDKLINKAKSSFNDPSNNKLIASDRHIILYSNLFDNLELLENNKLNITNFLTAVSEKI